MANLSVMPVKLNGTTYSKLNSNINLENNVNSNSVNTMNNQLSGMNEICGRSQISFTASSVLSPENINYLADNRLVNPVMKTLSKEEKMALYKAMNTILHINHCKTFEQLIEKIQNAEDPHFESNKVILRFLYSVSKDGKNAKSEDIKTLYSDFKDMKKNQNIKDFVNFAAEDDSYVLNRLSNKFCDLISIVL